jgi:UDP-N-acetylmuramate--alanine ligase
VTAYALRTQVAFGWPRVETRGMKYVRGKHVHFMGIGGIGVSGLARLARAAGATVSGCDRRLSPAAAGLVQDGVRVWIRHSPEHLAGVDILVHTSAIREADPELIAARAQGIEVVSRLPMLLKIAEDKQLVGIAGSHGKTTTTALVSALLVEAGMEPWCAVGGVSETFESNARAGASDWFVAELDESDGHIADASCAVAVLTNVDREHFEHYGDFEEICRTFRSYLANVADDGCAIVCADSHAALTLARASGKRFLAYGLGESAAFRAVDVELGPDSSVFTAETPSGRIESLRLGLTGVHNVQNAMAVVAIAAELGVSEQVLRRTLEHAPHVGRRMEIHALGRGVTVIVDYAHHPAKVAATLAAVRLKSPGRVIAVFQPHRYSRTLHLGAEFGPAFAGVPPVHLSQARTTPVDRLIVLPIYSASEDPIPGVTGEVVARAAREAGVNATYVRSREDALAELTRTLRRSDTLLLMGAGDVNELLEDLRARL